MDLKLFEDTQEDYLKMLYNNLEGNNDKFIQRIRNISSDSHKEVLSNEAELKSLINKNIPKLSNQKKKEIFDQLENFKSSKENVIGIINEEYYKQGGRDVFRFIVQLLN